MVKLGDASHKTREKLVTFDMLEHHPLVTDQSTYELQWDQLDVLYQFIDRIPAWVVDDAIFKVWKTGLRGCRTRFSWMAGQKSCVQAGTIAVMVTCQDQWWHRFSGSQVVLCSRCVHSPVSGADKHQRWCQRHHQLFQFGPTKEHKCPLSASQVLGKNLLPKSIERRLPGSALDCYVDVLHSLHS